jgi:hypothetical protein
MLKLVHPINSTFIQHENYCVKLRRSIVSKFTSNMLKMPVINMLKVSHLNRSSKMYSNRPIPNGVLSLFITPPLPPHSVHDFMELLNLAPVPS